MFKQIQNQTFPQIEDEVTSFWKKNNIFQKSVDQRSSDNPYSFVDGPPFVSGLPHYGHLLVSIAKDVVPRYWTMKGKRVRRIFGWDCHGLPIENKVNQKLGIVRSHQVENEIGVDRYVEECRKYVESCIEDWEWYIDKVGRWVDMKNAYKTMYPEYSESVIWAFKQMYDKGYVYKGKRVSLYSTDTATPVSNFEVAMDSDNYQDAEDLSVYVKFELDQDRSKKSNVLDYLLSINKPIYFAAWTTTPWTLPSNFALAVNKDEQYVVVKRVRNVMFEKTYGCVVKKEDKYVLVKSKRSNTWVFPSGHSEPNESTLNSAIRETKEETGFDVKIVTSLGKINYQQYFDGKDSNELYHKETQLFLADIVSEKFKSDHEVGYFSYEEAKERLDETWFKFVELAEKISKGKMENPLNLSQNIVLENNVSVEYLVFAEKLLSSFPVKNMIIAKRFKGEELLGLAYKPIFNYFEGNKNDFKIYEGSFVSMEDGTGIVHIAPAFGEDDFNTGKKYKLSDDSDIDSEGNLTIKDYEGIYIRDSMAIITNDLRKKDVLIKSHKYVHRLPYYRGKNPLIYVAQEAYFINIQKIKRKMLTLNKKVNWVPEYIKDGRFGQTIETSPDWCVSRNRYWATVMPIWKNNKEESIVVGSIKELMQYTDQVIEKEEDGKLKYFFKSKEGNLLPFSFHRDICDKIVLKKDGEEYRRIPEVLDVWMDSGSVPFAEFHYPFENKEQFEKSFPSDFIVEYIGQVRAWFNVLFRVSTLIFEKSPYKNVVCTGVLAGNDGRKMSKTYGNYPDPKEVLEKIGGDALRLYMMGSPIMSGGDMNWSDELLKKQVQNVILPLWNTVRFFLIYAESNQYSIDQKILKENGELDLSINSKNKLDKWIESRLNLFVQQFSKQIEKYEIANATKEIQPFVEDLSTWYVRRSRNRFSENDKEAMETLYKVLVRFSISIAPVMPFLSEKIYQVLVKNELTLAKESVHLMDYPTVKNLTVSQSRLVASMEEVRSLCNLVGSLRNEGQIKVKQVLSKVAFVHEDREFETWELDLIKEEMNIKEVVQVDSFDELIVEGNWMKNENDKFQLVLNIEITQELKLEGMQRELTRAIQSERKKKGLELKDIAILSLSVPTELKEFIDNSKELIKITCKIKDVNLVSETEMPKESIDIKLDDKNVKMYISMVN